MARKYIYRILAAFGVAIGLFLGAAFSDSAPLQATAGSLPAITSPYKRPIRKIDSSHVSAKVLRDEARNHDKSGTAAIEYSLWKARNPVAGTSTRLQQAADRTEARSDLNQPLGDRNHNRQKSL